MSNKTTSGLNFRSLYQDNPQIEHMYTTATSTASHMQKPFPPTPYLQPKSQYNPSQCGIHGTLSLTSDQYDSVQISTETEDDTKTSHKEQEEMQFERETTVTWRTAEGLRRWSGYVEHPESQERSSIRLEAKKVKEAEQRMRTGERR